MLCLRGGPDRSSCLRAGNTGNSDARNLLNAVNYEAEVTWNEATSMSKRDNIGNLLMAVFGLIGILLLIGVVFGVFFGGIRVLMTKYFPGTFVDLPENVEILQLHLDDRPPVEQVAENKAVRPFERRLRSISVNFLRPHRVYVSY